MNLNHTTFETIIKKLKQSDLNNKTKGSMFEKLSKHLLKERDTANTYRQIYLWEQWGKRWTRLWHRFSYRERK